MIVAGNQPAPQWLEIASAVAHVEAGIGIWDWASNDHEYEPDVIMACAGDVPTIEALAALDYLRQQVPEVRIRFVNVLELGRLQPAAESPHWKIGTGDWIWVGITTRIPVAAAVPSHSAAATAAAVANTPLFRRANFRNRYHPDGGHACTVSSFR